MRLAVLLSLALLAPATVFAHEAKVTGEGMSEEFATAQAMRTVPKGASVTGTSPCRQLWPAVATLVRVGSSRQADISRPRM